MFTTIIRRLQTIVRYRYIQFLRPNLSKDSLFVILQIGVAIFLLRLPNVQYFLWSGDASPILSRAHAIQELTSVLSPFRLFSQPFSGGRISAEQGSWFLLMLKAVPIAVGFDAVWFQRLSIYLIPVFASLSMYVLARSLGMARWIGLVTGSLFAYSPPIFNFLTMGWDYIAWSYALLPLTVWLTAQSLQRYGRLTLAASGAIAGLFSISTTLLPIYLLFLGLLTLDFLVKRNERYLLREKLIRILCFWTIFPLLHLFWFIPRIVYHLPTPLGELAKSEPSLGTVSRVNLLSAISLKGTQYNDSYWRFYPDSFPNIYLVLSFAAILAVFTRSFRQVRSFGWVFGVGWLCLLVLSATDQRSIIGTLDSLGLGRDSARLIATASFPMTVMVGYFLMSISASMKPTLMGQLSVLVPIALVLVAYPYITPGISNSLDDREPGIALRPRQVNLTAISRVGELASDSTRHWGVLQLPSFPVVFSARDTRFDGAYQSTTNPWLTLSVPTYFHLNDKSSSQYGIELSDGAVARTYQDALLTIDPGKLVFEMNRFGLRYLVIDQTFLGDIDEAIRVLSHAVDGENHKLFRLISHFHGSSEANPSLSGDVYVYEVVRAASSIKLFIFGRTPPLEARVLNVGFSDFGTPSEIIIEKPAVNRSDIIVNFSIANNMPIKVTAFFLEYGEDCRKSDFKNRNQSASRVTDGNSLVQELKLKSSLYGQVSNYIPSDSLSVMLENVPICEGVIRLRIDSPMNRLQSLLFISTVLSFAGLSVSALISRKLR